MTIEKNKKVVVAMSGGIDSSVAAALLKRSGFQVEGIFMKLFSDNSGEQEKRAHQVCDLLKIPFRVVDFRKEFKNKIIKSFIEEYKNGRTPNPCVVCNKEIKFGLFLKDVLMKKGVLTEKGVLTKENVLMATGHYVRLRRKNLNSKKQISNKSQILNCKLLKARDKYKDQSYFLWTLGQDQLKKTIFPLGKYTKKRVRELAKKFALPVLNIPESQEICFVKESLGEFLGKKIKNKEGNIVNPEGNVIGRHQGLHFYTIGQRKGIELNEGPAFARLRQTVAGRPWYVTAKDVKNNVLVVSQEQKDLMKKEFIAEKVNWISGEISLKPFQAQVKIRYGFLHKATSAHIEPLDKESVKIIFKNPQRAITPGQSAVFYQGKELLGGGIIK